MKHPMDNVNCCIHVCFDLLNVKNNFVIYNIQKNYDFESHKSNGSTVCCTLFLTKYAVSNTTSLDNKMKSDTSDTWQLLMEYFSVNYGVEKMGPNFKKASLMSLL